jgi:hypothetical protein
MPDIQNGEQSAFQSDGINCPGDRPWLGENAAEPNCTQPLVGALINQTNLYFPRIISAIALPDVQLMDDAITALRSEIEQEPALGVALTQWRMGGTDEHSDIAADMKRKLARRGVDAQESDILKALESLFNPVSGSQPSTAVCPANPESEFLAFRRAEFNIIRHELNDPEHIRDLRIIPVQIPGDLVNWLERVNLVERLRETRVFYGFDRLQQTADPLAGMPETGLRQLFRVPPVQPQERWLPAVEVFGEGIYLELREDCISRWQADNASWLSDRLDDAFLMRLSGISQTLPPLAAADRNWASRYLLIHSFAHTMINQLVFECGYSTASLRERLFVSSDPAAPMAGILIYTAAGDSEGTLGGLVTLGRTERLGPVVKRALGRASWCSADPVCSEHLGGQGSKLANIAACHACLLLPETSCETVNQGLDRAMVLGTPDARGHGIMSALIEEMYELA